MLIPKLRGEPKNVAIVMDGISYGYAVLEGGHDVTSSQCVLMTFQGQD